MDYKRNYINLFGVVLSVVGWIVLLKSGAFDNFVGSLIQFQSFKLVRIFNKLNEDFESYSLTIYNGFPPISILDFAGSILACLSYRMALKSQKSWFESLVSCTLMQFGGTTLTGLLLGQTPSWIISHSAFPALVLAWWLTFFCPRDLYFNFMESNKVILFIVGIVSAISSGHAVTSWGLDKAAFNTFHTNHVRISQSVLTCILCGTLSACGGGLLSDWLRFTHPSKAYTLSLTPAMFGINKFASTSTLNRSFILACFYFCMLNQHFYMPWRYRMPKEFAHLVISFLQVTNFLVRHQYPKLDIFQNFSTYLLSEVLLINLTVDEFGGYVEEEGEEVVEVYIKQEKLD